VKRPAGARARATIETRRRALTPDASTAEHDAWPGGNARTIGRGAPAVTRRRTVPKRKH
jgi:hypothetical protein